MKKVTFLIVLLALCFSWDSTAQITSYPYSEDFEAGDGGWVATNGANGTWALGTPSASVINSAASGVNAWATNLSGNYNNSDNSFVQSPEFDLSALSAPSIQFSVWWNSEFSWDGLVLQSSIDGGATWQNVGAAGDPNNWYNDTTIGGNPGGQQVGWTGRNSSSNGSNGWVVARHALTGLAGQSSVYFRFAFGSDTSVVDNGVAFDLISVFEVTCPEPSGLTFVSATSNSANISWTPGGGETNWEVAVQPDGTGNPSGSGDPTANNSPYMAMGLNPATQYEVYVRSSCGGEFSPWVGPLDFVTECVSYTAPYTEGFENAGTIPLCWSMSGGEVWRFSNTGAGNHIGNNGTITGTTATNGYFAWVDSSGTDAPATLLSPLVDVSTLTVPALSFYEISNNEGNANSTLTVDVWDGAAWNNVGVYNTNTSGWELKIIDLSGLTITGDIQVRFVFSETTASDFYDDIAIDDVRIDEAPSCIIPAGLAVNNVAGTTADISWSPGTGTAWEYVIQPAGTGVPSGNGAPLTVTTVNETGLDYSTSYEVYIRTDCGANGFSDWVGPLTFTTTIQMDFTVDCTAGPVNSVTCYDSDDGIGQMITFTSLDGTTPLSLTVNSGNVEWNTFGGEPYDDFIVLDSDGVTELYNGGGNLGDLTGLNFQSTGPTISFYVEADFTISCQSSTTINPIDISVTCATCVNPTATYAVRSDCFTGPQFYVDVDVTSLGSATSLTLTDNQGSAPQTINNTGLVSFGPYPNATNVQITVASDDDTNCVRTSNILTQPFCLDTLVNCNVGPVSVSYCYQNSDPNVFSYTSSDGSPLNLTINSGEIEGAPFDFLIILDSDGVTELYNGEGNDGDISGLTFQSTGDTIYFSIDSDTSVSCTSGSFPDGIDYTVACATCINPTATYTIIDDCDNGPQFLIDVNITSLGDATSLTVTDNQGSAGVPVTSTGVVQMGPYPFATPIIITISNDQDVNCVINSSPLQVAACPPANDNCPGATVAVVNQAANCDNVTPGTVLAANPSGVPNGSCAGNPDDDVWFQFTALHEVELISLINITGGTTNLDHAVYSGSCGSLTELYCSPNNSSFTPVLTIGSTYYIRVFSGGSVPESSTFDLCIQPAPENTVCEQAANFCSAGGSSTGPNIIGFPNNSSIACLGTAPNPSWNIIQVGDPGLIEIEISQYNNASPPAGLDVDFVLWGPFDTDTDFCSLGLEVDCPTCPNNTSNPNFYPFGNIVDCSYDPAFIENLTIPNAQTGEIYVLLVTNFSNQSGNITITQTNSGPGAGSTVAEIQVDLGGDQAQCGVSSVVLTADSPFADTYEWYADGFVIEGETGPTLTVTETNTYTVIVYDSQCDVYADDTVTITLGTEPVANAVPDIVTCDDVSGDGVEEFDLESQTAGVLGGQDASLYNVTYHATLADAINGVGALTSPYTNIANPQTIYVRVEDANATACVARTTFDLVITGATPTATSADMEICDDPSGDGFESFVLTDNDVNILNGQSSTDYAVTYYLSQADAMAGTGALTSPYTNITNPQTIWARVDNVNATNCYALIDFDLIVTPIPTANASPDVAGCDTDDNGIAEYDLTVNENIITGGQTGLVLTYYTSMADADAGTGAISPFDYETTLTTIYVRVVDSVTGCYALTSFNLVAGELPMTTFTTDFDYEVCPNATVPIVITATPQNYSTADVSVVWYQDGGEIPGETGLTLPVLVAGTYTIEVTFNETGCKNSTSQEVIELENCIIPQGISPDGDGKNDTFDLSSFNVKRIEIFNRLGTLVYSKDNYTNEWHGQTNSGDELPVGTYFYVMVYEGGAKQMSAWVYLNK
ncbi:gliding motility-associated C-terminal domain-containing protein [Subsaxibacter sp. CAU 1640]|uniref:T9SS type B sorting domain-containing protein n=1 Tax=Subsaxibacter sp. CAU 1640 TaxID=2933271 RepID=UPI002002DB79|nr:gliding motility-associated C-terminal domain-containing protein [Subsaxibacter sp. CAU 1640]MCK7589354.1 gliding motility-associated C-terminal domain-containing protein [Subsaxibacter sp. CAU 1640]